jgi:hypothetical protein
MIQRVRASLGWIALMVAFSALLPFVAIYYELNLLLRGEG